MLNVFSPPNAALKSSLLRQILNTLTVACVLAITLTACESDEKRKNYIDFGPEAWDEPENSADGKISDGSGKTFEVGYLKNNGHSSPKQSKLESDLSTSSWVIREHPSPNPVKSVTLADDTNPVSASDPVATTNANDSVGDSETPPTKYEYYYQNGGAISAQMLNLDESYCVLNQIPAGFVGQSPNDAVEALFLPKQIKLSDDELTLELHNSENKFFLVCHHLDRKSAESADRAPAAAESSPVAIDFASLISIFGDAVLVSKATE